MSADGLQLWNSLLKPLAAYKLCLEKGNGQCGKCGGKNKERRRQQTRPSACINHQANISCKYILIINVYIFK